MADLALQLDAEATGARPPPAHPAHGTSGRPTRDAAAERAVIELFQLTGIPAELGKFWPPVRLVLGTTFGTADLGAYSGGAAVAYAVDRTAGRWNSRQMPILAASVSERGS
jgi:hypothetical protein